MSGTFLFFALLFPRITLLISWLADNIPANHTPFLADFLGTLFFPRFLVAYWIWDTNRAIPESVSLIWLVLFILLGIVELLGGGSKASHSDH